MSCYVELKGAQMPGGMISLRIAKQWQNIGAKQNLLTPMFFRFSDWQHCKLKILTLDIESDN